LAARGTALLNSPTTASNSAECFDYEQTVHSFDKVFYARIQYF